MTHNNSDWKACNRHKRFPSSNLGHSAQMPEPHKVSASSVNGGKRVKNARFRGVLTAKPPHQDKMRKITVNIYYRGNVDKQGTAPLLIAVNHASSTCYIPIAGVRLKPNQWDARHKKVVKHPQADTINSVAVTTLGKVTEAVMKLGNVRGMTTAKVRDMIAEYIYPSDDIDTGFMAVLQSYMNQCDRPNTADKFKQTQTHIKRWLGSHGKKQILL